MNTDNIVDFPEMDTALYPLEVIVESMRDHGVTQAVIFGINGEGEVEIWSTHSAQETDNLIDDGIEEWERLLEYSEDEEEDDGE